MKTILEMAREAGWKDLRDYDSEMRHDFFMGNTDSLARFAELVRADERNIVMNEPLTKAQWQRFEDEIRADEREKYKWDVHSCGPTCKRYACVATREAVAAEREACAKVCETEWSNVAERMYGEECATAIRARGNT